MNASFQPKKFTKKEWEDARAEKCKGSGVGKALDAWQKDCTKPFRDMTLQEIAKAATAAKNLLAALEVAKKKCHPLAQRETLAGIAKYKKKVDEFIALLKKAHVSLDKRKKLTDSLSLKTATEDNEVLAAFEVYCKKKAFIYESLDTYLLCKKKKYEEAVRKYSSGGKGGGDYNIQAQYNQILYNTFVAKIREDQKDVIAAINDLQNGQVQMLSDARHYNALSEYDSYIKMLDKRFPIEEFSLA